MDTTNLETKFGKIVSLSNNKNCHFKFISDSGQYDPNAKHIIIQNYKIQNFLLELEKCYLAAKAFDQTTHQDDDIIYNAFLSVSNPKEHPIKTVLEVVAYEKRPYIWLRRCWYDRKKPTTTEDGTWMPCRYGFRFSPEDEELESIKEFLQAQLQKE